MDPTFVVKTTISEKIDFNKFQGKALVYIKKIKKAKRFNKNYKQELSKIYEILNYNNYGFLTQIKLNLFLEKKSKKDLEQIFSNSKIKEENLRNLYDIVSIHAILQFYKVIELSFKSLLIGVEYNLGGKKYKVNGNEPLGRIRDILTQDILRDELFFWDEIDIEFRNALAHGGYLVKNHKFLYYSTTDFSKPKELSLKQFTKKSFNLSMMAISIVGAVGEWWNEENFKLDPECDKYFLK